MSGAVSSLDPVAPEARAMPLGEATSADLVTVEWFFRIAEGGPETVKPRWTPALVVIATTAIADALVQARMRPHAMVCGVKFIDGPAWRAGLYATAVIDGARWPKPVSEAAAKDWVGKRLALALEAQEAGL